MKKIIINGKEYPMRITMGHSCALSVRQARTSPIWTKATWKIS